MNHVKKIKSFKTFFGLKNWLLKNLLKLKYIHIYMQILNEIIRFKLSVRWFIYVDFRNYKMIGCEKLKLLHVVPSNNTFLNTHIGENKQKMIY